MNEKNKYSPALSVKATPQRQACSRLRRDVRRALVVNDLLCLFSCVVCTLSEAVASTVAATSATCATLLLVAAAARAAPPPCVIIVRRILTTTTPSSSSLDQKCDVIAPRSLRIARHLF